MRQDAADERSDLLELPPADAEALLRAHFAARGQPGYRTRQTLTWLYERDAMSFDEMSDLPAGERAALQDTFRLSTPVLARAARSTDGTVKHLWQLTDHELIQSVLIPAPSRPRPGRSPYGGHVEAPVAAYPPRAHRVRAHSLARPADPLHLVAGRLRDGVHILRDRLVRLPTPAHRRRDRRTVPRRASLRGRA